MDPIYFQSKSAKDFRFLSNFYFSPVTDVDGEVYPTVEHFYQAMKCALPEQRNKIRECGSPRDAKQLGSCILMVVDWEEPFGDFEFKKEAVMYAGLLLKFQQHEDLKERLLATGDRELVEYAPWGDTFWGVDKSLYGQNRLGKLLMRVRKELRDPEDATVEQE